MNKPKLAQLDAFAPESKLWIYVAERPLREEEEQWAAQQLNAFTTQWTAHNQALLATSEVFDNQVVVLMVDETRAGASGCSIDKSVHFLEQMGAHIGVDFFDRMTFGWLSDEGDMRFSKRDALADLVKQGTVHAETLMLNTLAQCKKDFEGNWLLPFGKSWHRRLV